jgi:exoribonuclease-2
MSVIVSDMTVHREWAIYEKRSELVCAPLAVVTPRTVSLTSGDKIPRHRVWLIVQEESTPLVVEAKAYAASMDIDILWRAAAGRSLDAATLAACVNAEGNVGTLAVVQKIINNPAYFYRNSGVFQPAAAEVLEKAKAALCRRASDAKEEEQLLTELSAGRIPQEVAAAAVNLLMRKNKNTSIFKAVKKAAGGEQHIAEYLVKIGLFADARSCWEAMFIHNWPAPSTEDKVSLPALPFSSARAFSVDDAGTIEVDDAFSVQAEGSGWLIGLHIAVPAMAPLSVGDYETMRLTSVYFPDVKHPMLSSEQPLRQ